MDTERTYTVTGMTCEHCVAAVKDEVERIAGVCAAQVDLESGRLVVRGEDVGEDAVRAAVDEAGYEIASWEARP